MKKLLWLVLLFQASAFGQEITPDVTLIRASGLKAHYEVDPAIEHTPENVFTLLKDVCEKEAAPSRVDQVILHTSATSGIYDVLNLSRVADFSSSSPDAVLTMRKRHDPDGPPEDPLRYPGSVAIELGGGKIKIHDITIVGDSYDTTEDGALIGWSAPADAEVECENVVFDGSQNCDWVFYDWQSYRKKSITFEDCTIRHARMGLCLMAGWGEYHVTMKRVHFLGDANGSKTFGASSGLDPITGGLLGNVVRGHGTWTLEGCTAEMVGLKGPYNSRWGCPRIAPWTNHYNTSSNPALKVTLTNTRVKSINPGTATVVNDLDFRYGVVPEIDNSELVSAARGGTGKDGEFRVWQAD